MALSTLNQALSPLEGRADVTTAETLETVVVAFNRDTGSRVDSECLSAGSRALLRKYLADNHFEPGGATLFHKVPTLQRLPLYEDMAAKVSWLHQYGCKVCPAGHEFPTHFFPIGIPPWSHQNSRGVGPALARAINSSPAYASSFHLAESSVCMRLVFVLGEGATMKDCDNMAKGVLDAFEGLLYVDDRQVEHLDLIKVHQTISTDGYILVRIASSSLNDHQDVLDHQHAKLLWMSEEDLDITRFL